MEQNRTKPSYEVVVIGANGGIGKQVVLAALGAGHSVTAILRTPANLEIVHPNLRVVHGDVLKPGSLDEHLVNKDVVISAIGSTSLKKTTLYSEGIKNLINAIPKAQIRHAFFISASGLEINPTHSLIVRFLTKYVLQTLLRNMYADLWKMERIVKASAINWTIIRPPKLINSPAKTEYRTEVGQQVENGLEISRADVAHFIVNNLANDAIIKRTVEIAY